MDNITYKLTELKVPSDDPFQFDALTRKPSVEAVSSLIGQLSGPFVLAIDSPWGTGKTTFVRMLKSVLETREYPCLYFNAWETDFSTDPLVAFLGEISTLLSEDIAQDSELAKYFNKTKKIATRLAKRGLPLAAKLLTNGVLDIDAATEKILADGVSETVSDAVDEYIKEKELIKEFHKTLGKVIEQLNEEGKPSQIIIFVDEIDRCRPTYAVELLERIKHLFNIENVIFVVSLDKGQLRTSLGAVYGQGIDADEYLRRFIDLEFLLPKPNAEAFTKSLFERFGFRSVFEKIGGEETEDLLYAFVKFSGVFNLSLRACEQCLARIQIAIMLSTPRNNLSHLYVLTFLIILKMASPQVYHRLAFEDGSVTEVLEYLKQEKRYEENRLEVCLIAAKFDFPNKPEELIKYEKQKEDLSISEEVRKRAEWMYNHIESFYSQHIHLPSLINKIELAAQFK